MKRVSLISLLFLVCTVAAVAQQDQTVVAMRHRTTNVVTVCPSTTVGYFTQETCTTTGGITWSATTNGQPIRVEVIGGGGSGMHTGSSQSSGGGGGYASDIVAYSSGSNITVTVGTGGAAPAYGANGNSGSASSFSSSVAANGGIGPTSGSTTAAGGAGTAGSIRWSGGAGNGSSSDTSGGAGGAGGPNGTGANGGGAGSGNQCGGGGGGSGGGGAGGNSNAGVGGSNFTGTQTGGTSPCTGSTNGNPGTGDANGASGGGGSSVSGSSHGGNGGAGTEYGTKGSGGGAGGGAGDTPGAYGGNGGLYGGGGGGAGYPSGGSAGNGAQGLVVITYSPTTIVPILKQFTYVAQTSSSSIASITSPSITVAANDLLVVFCGTGSFNASITSIPTTSSQSNVWNALTMQGTNSSTGTEQESWAIASGSAATTFTCTPTVNAPYQSMAVLDFSNTGTTINTNVGSSSSVSPGISYTSPSWTTSQRTLNIYCTLVDPTVLGYFSASKIAGARGYIGGVSNSNMYTTSWSGCTYDISAVGLTSQTATNYYTTINTPSGWAGTFAAFNF